MRRCTNFIMVMAVMALSFSCDDKTGSPGKRATYYISATGDDSTAGSRDRPWKTIDRLNRAALSAGDSVFFQGGQPFEGRLLIDSTEFGTGDSPIVITSTPGAVARIRSGNSGALVIGGSSYIHVLNLNFEGNGRKEGNTENGIVVSNSHHVLLDSLEVAGFQKAGVSVYASHEVELSRIHAHDNGAAGISVSGNTKKEECGNIFIHDCFAENNPGDPTNFTNHSGNGIVVGICRGVVIEYCAATNNGWDMPRIGNGPVGIWAWEADSVIIQHCISYRNKTSKGGEDGGGFDLDGGMTNSVIQYCLSYENAGAGFGIFQYAGASPWKNNTIRYNISDNDGVTSTAHAGIYVWNSSGDENQFSDCLIYNNTIYNAPGSAIRFSGDSKRKGFRYYNNIFVAHDELITGESENDSFVGNDWWTLTGGFNVGGVRNFQTWVALTGQEKLADNVKGANENPGFDNSGAPLISFPRQITSFPKYKLPLNSNLRTAGIDLKTSFGIAPGNYDFHGNLAPANGMGASY